MTKILKVLEPVLLRSSPSAIAPIVNAIKAGSKIEIVGEEHGWYKTITGFYIFKDKATKLVNTNKILAQAKLRSMLPRELRLEAEKAEDKKEQKSEDIDVTIVGKPVKVTGDIATDYDGNKIDDGAKQDNSSYTITGTDIEKGTVTIASGDGNSVYVVPLSDISYKSKSDDKNWTNIETNDLTQIAVKAQYQETLNFVKNLATSVADAANDFSTWWDNIGNIKVENTRSIFGMPYQYLPTADTRYDETTNLNSFGKKYMNKIVSRAPIIIMQAGSPNFMYDYNSEQTEGIVDELKKQLKGEDFSDKDNTTLNKLLNNGGRYYSFKLEDEAYYSAVTAMCRAIAVFLNIGGVKVNINGYESTLINFNWRRAAQHDMFGYYHGAVSFYINSEAQVQESASTSTRQSQLASKVNQISDLASEIHFLLGGASGGLDAITGGRFGSGFNILTQEDMVKNGTSNSDGILGVISKNIRTMMAGGKMFFPEIWSDSQFSRSYDITIKLDTPTCDVLSIYLNLFVPLAHILAFVLPRSSGDNTYISPFLVRAYYKSMFNIDMGIITSCNITKGEQGCWTQDGLPTQITVQISIKDLYDLVTLSVGNKLGITDLISNTGQIDYLATMCGLNIGKGEGLYKYLQLWYATKVSALGDLGYNKFSSIINWGYAKYNNLLTRRAGQGIQ